MDFNSGFSSSSSNSGVAEKSMAGRMPHHYITERVNDPEFWKFVHGLDGPNAHGSAGKLRGTPCVFVSIDIFAAYEKNNVIQLPHGLTMATQLQFIAGPVRNYDFGHTRLNNTRLIFMAIWTKTPSNEDHVILVPCSAYQAVVVPGGVVTTENKFYAVARSRIILAPPDNIPLDVREQETDTFIRLYEDQKTGVTRIVFDADWLMGMQSWRSDELGLNDLTPGLGTN